MNHPIRNRLAILSSSTGIVAALLFAGFVPSRGQALEPDQQQQLEWLRLGTGPKLRAESKTLHLGSINRGEARNAEFIIVNEGDEDLRILEVGASCGCTIPAYDETIAPGTSGIITVTLTTATLSGDVTRNVVARTNDPRAERVPLILEADVLSSVELLPVERMRVSNEDDDDRVSRLVVRQDPTESGELQIAGITVSADYLDASAKQLQTQLLPTERMPVMGRPGDWLLEVRLARQAPPGLSLQQLSFETGLGRQPEISIPVTVNYLPPVTLNVERVVLPPPGSGTTSRTLLMTVRKDLDPETLQIAAEPESLKVELRQTGERHFKIDLSWGSRPIDAGALTFQVGGESYRIPVTRPAGA